MNLRTITAKLKAFVAAAKALARGLFFKSQRGVEWHRLTHDRYPWVVAFISLAMVLVMLRIVFFILSPDGKRYAEMASKVNPPRYSAVEPMRGSIYARDGRPVAVTSPVYRLFFDFGHEALEPLRQPLPPKDGDSKQQAKREQILKLRAEYDAGLDSLAELMANTFDLSARKLTKAKLKARWTYPTSSTAPSSRQSPSSSIRRAPIGIRSASSASLSIRRMRAVVSIPSVRWLTVPSGISTTVPMAG